MAYQIPLTIKETLENVASGRFVLPAIQREFVWAQEPDRMCRLFDSILRGYPIGTFLFWKVSPDQSKEFHFYEVMLDWHERKNRHNDRLHLAEPRELVAILDGQQRLTTLNIGLYGTIAHKVPRKRVDAIDAYPPKRLYLDLGYEPGEDDDLQFRFDFLTDEQARVGSRSGAHWYLVSDILDVDEPGEPIFEYVQAHDLGGSNRAFRALARLWKAVHEDGVVSYFEEREQSLSKVLDAKWDDIERALRVGVKLLAAFGFSEATLPANSVLIPIADYVYDRNLDESYVTSANPSVRADRAALRDWTIRTIVRPGIWGSGLDSLLKGLHQQIKDTTGGFPIAEIEAEMARKGKALTFDEGSTQLVTLHARQDRGRQMVEGAAPGLAARTDISECGRRWRYCPRGHVVAKRRRARWWDSTPDRGRRLGGWRRNAWCEHPSTHLRVKFLRE